MTKKTKFTFPISDHIYNSLKSESQAMGISMTGYLNYLLAQHFNTKETMLASIKEIIQKAVDEETKKNTQG